MPTRKISRTRASTHTDCCLSLSLLLSLVLVLFPCYPFSEYVIVCVSVLATYVSDQFNKILFIFYTCIRLHIFVNGLDTVSFSLFFFLLLLYNNFDKSHHANEIYTFVQSKRKEMYKQIRKYVCDVYTVQSAVFDTQSEYGAARSL